MPEKKGGGGQSQTYDSQNGEYTEEEKSARLEEDKKKIVLAKIYHLDDGKETFVFPDPEVHGAPLRRRGNARRALRDAGADPGEIRHPGGLLRRPPDDLRIQEAAREGQNPRPGRPRPVRQMPPAARDLDHRHVGLAGEGKDRKALGDPSVEACPRAGDPGHELNGTKNDPGEYKEILGLKNIDKIINITQEPIGRTPRSNPATYTGVFDDIRALFAETDEARARGYDKGRFSFNVPGGRCEKCQGAGVTRIPMSFLPDVYVKCDECEGKRYNDETLLCTYKGKNIHVGDLDSPSLPCGMQTPISLGFVERFL